MGYTCDGRFLLGLSNTKMLFIQSLFKTAPQKKLTKVTFFKITVSFDFFEENGYYSVNVCVTVVLL